MAQFQGTLHGSARTAASRQGTKMSGLAAHLRGWNLGVYVEVQHRDGRDTILVYRTGGSNSPALQECIASLGFEGGDAGQSQRKE